MRLFTGISLAPHVSEKLLAVMDDLRPVAAINWSPVGNLHITSKFIGTWPDERLDELQQAIGNVRAAGPIQISVSKFGFLPNPHRPAALVAGVQTEGPALADLAAALGAALEPLGCPAESRPYKPHVTLARIKTKNDIVALRERIAATSDVDFGSFEASQFHLYSSTPGQRSSVYNILATYDLIREND